MGDGSSLVLLEDAVLEYQVEHPANSGRERIMLAHGYRGTWDSASPCPFLPTIHPSSRARRREI